MDRLILTLDEISSGDTLLVGGKAQRLAELRQAGFPVPPGFVVTTAAQRAARDEPDGWPAALRQAVATAYAALGSNVAVAVRSSALAEDLHQASFAGQYATFLNVAGLDALLEHISACWASLHEERAVHYRRSNRIEAPPEMAVLVQRLVPAEASGVLFTLNPLTGLEKQLVIEASWGLGEAIVSGLVTPDRYVVDRYECRIISSTVAEKRLLVRTSEQGTTELETPAELRSIPVLSEAQILELAALGERVQEHFGEPQDIEWAFSEGQFFLLQSRPLTAYRFTEEIGQWTSANVREVMPGIATPLSFSLSFEYDFARAFREFFWKIGLVKNPNEEITSARLFFGRPYWRIDRLKLLMRELPGFKERAFDETVGIEPTYEGEGYVTPVNLRTILRGLPVLLRIWWNYLTYASYAARFKKRYLQQASNLRRIDPRNFSDRDLAVWVARMIEMRWQVNSIALTCSFLSTQAQDDFHAILDPLNESLPPEERISEGRLMTGLSGMSTAGPLLALWEIVRIARRFPGVSDTIRSTPPEHIKDALLSFPAGRDFWRACMEGYIDRFHYLSSNDEDLSLPRWDEDPSVPLALLHSFMTSAEDTAPSAREAEQRRVRKAEERRALGLFFKRPLFITRLFIQLAIVRRYVWWREGLRDTLGMAHYHCRRALVEQGRRWAGSYLEREDDIFWLYRHELLHALEGSLSSDQARALVARRRQTARNYRNFNPPQIIGAGSRPAQREQLDGQLLTGVPCSPGIVEGRARVITRLDDAGRLQPGEILVAPYTNPGWTPLFSLAGAVVMEEGGLLSHGAVVARECGVPAVLQVKDATLLIRDSQLIRVDGSRGTVELLELT